MSRILITGCRGGIGLDAAIRLVKAGHFVYATVHKEKSVSELKKIFHPYSKNSLIEKLDITNSKDREKILDWDIDVLVNNAGIGDSGPLIEIDVQKIRDVFETNVFSAIELTQIALKKMIAKGSGRVVIVGSMYGLLPTPYLAPYGMSKFALENLAFSLRKELKPFGIYVVMVNPGSYNTGFNKKNIDKKYTWLDKNGLYKNHMDAIKKEEDLLYKLEVQNIEGISKQLVKAVVDKKPKKRYKAPLWQWLLIPVGRHFG
ncbi:MAG: SDR family NAD(P)-dependent oxidoreductase [Bacteroidota bacterium]|nr:SDR family NAD(P)-dependent oxidoreductase [Bacteroidota bacterium]